MTKAPATTYDPHSDVDLLEEMVIMSRGRLVKARLPDQAPPNVDWYWFPIGNCVTCLYYARMEPGEGKPHCLNPDIPEEDFLYTYLVSNTCPGFSAGDPRGDEVDGGENDGLDVMRAAGLAPGAPSQRVVILHDSPWTIDLAIRAHRESSTFLDMARTADYVARGGKNDPAWMDYVDLADDLERPVRDGAPPPAPGPDTASAAMSNFDPAQPRQPAGTPVGGEWVKVKAGRGEHAGKTGQVMVTNKAGVHTLHFGDGETGQVHKSDVEAVDPAFEAKKAAVKASTAVPPTSIADAPPSQLPPFVKQKVTNPDLPDGARAYLKTATTEELAALHEYTGGHAYQINAALWTGQPLRTDALKREHQLLQGLFANNPDMPKPVAVHRGVNSVPQANELAKQLIASKDSGQPWTHKGYVSTTTSQADTADSPMSMSIKAVNGVDVAPLTKGDPSEKEMILGAGAQFKVVSIAKRADGGWHAELEQLASKP